LKNFKPVRLIADERIILENPTQIIRAIGAIDNFFKIVGVTDIVNVSIHDLVDVAFLDIEQNETKKVMSGGALVGYMLIREYKTQWEYIEFLIVRDSLLMENDKIVHGLARYNSFGIASVGREDTKKNMLFAYLAVIHEMGHIYGLPAKDRLDQDLVKVLGNHCPNDCVMFPNNMCMNKIDIINNPFCNQCLSDLRKYFGK